MSPSLEQFTGSLIGQCLGDAVGCRVEGYPPEVCQNFVNYEVKPQRPKDRDRFPYPFGQYTDDSQLARELLQSYVGCSGFNPDDYAGRIAAIFTENRIVGRGRTTEAAALRLAQGIPWQDAGTPPPNAGNGSAMRAGPIGLMFYDNPAQLMQAAHEQGYITHQDPRCSAGSIAIAGAVALALTTPSIAPQPFLTQLSQWSRPFDVTFADALQQLMNWLDLPPTEAVIPISQVGLDPTHEREWPGISPFVIGSVLWSLYAFLRTPDDYWETICTAIAVGGDVDTTAAMSGAISGAYLGISVIPDQLAQQITDRGTWGYPELVDLAHKCYQLKKSTLRKQQQD